MSSMTEVVQTVKHRRADSPEREPPKASDADKIDPYISIRNAGVD